MQLLFKKRKYAVERRNLLLSHYKYRIKKFGDEYGIFRIDKYGNEWILSINAAGVECELIAGSIENTLDLGRGKILQGFVYCELEVLFSGGNSLRLDNNSVKGCPYVCVRGDEKNVMNELDKRGLKNPLYSILFSVVGSAQIGQQGNSKILPAGTYSAFFFSRDFGTVLVKHP